MSYGARDNPSKIRRRTDYSDRKLLGCSIGHHVCVMHPVNPAMHRWCELFRRLEAANRALHLGDVSGCANSVMT